MTLRNIAFLFILLGSIPGFCQSNKEKAHKLAWEANRNMHAGKTHTAIKQLEKAIKLDPNNINYAYELASVHYKTKKYNKAIKLLKRLTNRSNTQGKVWQLLGNCYQMKEKPAQAMASYAEGLRRFPAYGPLYFERGNIEKLNQRHKKALAYFEKGIAADPRFSLNYYSAAKLYLNSGEKLWGMLYGELFMNIERNSKRTVEISQKLFSTYRAQIRYTSDSSIAVSFCRKVKTTDSLRHTKPSKRRPASFGNAVYEPTLLWALIGEKQIDIASLNRTRTAFIREYFDKEYERQYPNLLFSYRKHMLDAGHADAYNYWLLMHGDPAGFQLWHKKNPKKWNDFIVWFSKNQLRVSRENYFHRNQFDKN